MQKTGSRERLGWARGSRSFDILAFERVEFGRAKSTSGALFAERLHDVELEELLPKIPFVEVGFEDALVRSFEFGEREFYRHEVTNDRRVVHARTNAEEGSVQDRVVIVRKLFGFSHGNPPRVCGVRLLLFIQMFPRNESDIRHRNDAPAWIAVELTECVELLQIHGRLDLSFFFDETAHRILRSFFRIYESSWKALRIGEVGWGD